MKTGLTVNVLRNSTISKHGNDCTLGGVSSKNDTLLLIGEGIDGPFTTKDAERAGWPVVKLVKRNLFDSVYMTVEPMDGLYAREGGNKWYMMGGNFCWSSDSRFPCSYPLPIHDRNEA